MFEAIKVVARTAKEVEETKATSKQMEKKKRSKHVNAQTLLKQQKKDNERVKIAELTTNVQPGTLL